MHYNNRLWLAQLKEQHPAWFIGTRVLEVGSGGADPVIRGLFEDADYTGIDIVDGPNVDVVADGSTFTAEPFDIVMCFSVLEHTPIWADILTNITDGLTREGSVIVGCHGAEGNQHHGPEPWKIVPEQDLLDHLATLPVTIVDAFFEEQRFGPDCTGAYDWILVRR